MTRNEFVSAISRLTVLKPKRDADPVVGRPIYQDAAIMFLRGGAGGWHWHNRRPGMPPADEGPSRDEFVKWLQKASEKAVKAYIENMGRYRTALNAAIAAGGELPLPKVFVPGTSWPPRRSAEEWRKTQHYAALLIGEAKTKKARDRSADGGEKRAKGLKQQGDNTKAEVLRLANEILRRRPSRPPTPLEAARIIAGKLDLSDDHVHRLLKRMEHNREISFGMKGAHAEKGGQN